MNACVRTCSGLVLGGLIVLALAPGAGACFYYFPSYRCEDNGTEDFPCSDRLVPGIGDPEKQCRPADGCQLLPGCRRVDCTPLSQALCESIPRCHWGSPGCLWDYSIQPADPCFPLDEPGCAGNPSCVWDKACFGEPKHCGSIADEDDCRAVSHCTWRQVRST